MSTGQTTPGGGDAPDHASTPGDDHAPNAAPAAGNDASTETTAPPEAQTRQTKLWYRVAFVFSIILIVSVILALPFAFGSMLDTVFGRSVDQFYDLETGLPIASAQAFGGEDDRTYINLTLTDLALDTGLVSMLVSGHRECTGDCPVLNLLILSLDESPVRRGMAPSAKLSITEPTEVFTEQATLPVAGNPSLYPFDVYAIKLAIGGQAVDADGTETPLTRENFSDNVEISVQDQVSALVMEPPIVFELPEGFVGNTPVSPIAGQELVLSRPTYLQVLTILLVMLIGISGILALLTRSIDDLLLGVGGLILGVWGIRSVMVPQPLPTLSIVDTSLSGVILILLIGLALRAAIHFHKQGELPTLWRKKSPPTG
jgi:hypothetical protein